MVENLGKEFMDHAGESTMTSVPLRWSGQPDLKIQGALFVDLEQGSPFLTQVYEYFRPFPLVENW
jgi:hypothetical protein